MFIKLHTFIFLALLSTSVLSQPDQFKTGPLIKDYGMIAAVPGAVTIPMNTVFKVSYDVAKKAGWGGLNRGLDTAARFINMHVANGVDVKNINLALVIHGGAVKDMVQDKQYQLFEGNLEKVKNVNGLLIKTLIKHGVKITICGQSAAYHGVNTKDLIPGVTMSLSAMTAHALLQQKGYTLNPF